MNWKPWRLFVCWFPLHIGEEDLATEGTHDVDFAHPAGETPPGDTPPADDPGAAGAGADVAADMADAIRGALAPKKSDDAAAPPAKDGAPPKAEEKPTPAAKPGDEKPPAKREDRYAVPNDLSPKGQARFKELVGELKSKDEEIGRFKGQIEAAQTFVADAQAVGVGAQEFNEFFEYMGAVKRGDGAAAMKFLQREMDHISKELGVARGPDDTSVLDDFPDLRDAVDSYKMTKEHAIELAQARAASARSQRQSETQAVQERQAAEAQQAENEAVDTVAKWFSMTAKEDIDFVRKKPLLLEQLPGLVEGVPPRLWITKVKAAYAILSKAAPAAASGGSPNPRPTPLRPNAGGGKPESTSMLDAIRNGLASQAGRGG